MAIWFLTIGNSDVQFKTADNWYELYNAQRNDYPLSNCSNNFSELDLDEATERFSTAARVIGLVYSNQEEYFTDLVFPLLDVFTQELESQSLSKIYLILSDQSEIFDDQAIEKPECPFWMDTCTLKPIITKYLNNKLPNTEKIISLIIKPKNQELRGIDHWDYMLDCVSKELTQKLFPSDSKEEIYVSHQAGTPAISSAVQFVSIGHSDRLKFLISNQTYNSETQEIKYEAELIESSKYWRNIQIQKAQKLLIEGNPSAADTVLEGVRDVDRSGIKEMVDLFNLKSSKTKNDDEFEPSEAAIRVRDALDLIEIFLGNENYLEAIALLAAAHETFLKASISFCFEVNTNFLNSKPRKPKTIVVNGKVLATSKVLQWNNQGLTLLFSYIQTQLNDRSISSKIETLKGLNFPTSHPDENINFENKLSNSDYINFKNIGSNNALLAWITMLFNGFQAWGLLKWIGTYKREYEDDLRNQLMHNLRGIEEDNIKQYFMGFPEEYDVTQEKRSTLDIFQEEVRSPFIQAMHHIGLITTSDESTNHIQEQLKVLADRLSESPQEPKK